MFRLKSVWFGCCFSFVIVYSCSKGFFCLLLPSSKLISLIRPYSSYLTEECSVETNLSEETAHAGVDHCVHTARFNLYIPFLYLDTRAQFRYFTLKNRA